MAPKKNLKYQKDLVSAVIFFESVKNENGNQLKNQIINEKLECLIRNLKEEVFQVTKKNLVSS